jgi:hypothetical protein
MSLNPASVPSSAARQVLTSAEKLERHRRATAAARAKAHALQVKATVAFTCVLSVPLGFGFYYMSASKPDVTRPQAAIEGEIGSNVRVGAIQLPYRGEMCRKLLFDNRTGIISGETRVPCAAVEVAPTLDNGNARAQAIMSAFKFK